ncbi:YqaJ viral recombinase family protein [Micromonospora sp. STR1s_5]|nr:YqaJ viral recombinase family protein [Micromonospora sp. STR1s_5]
MSDRTSYIGGSDARTIIGKEEGALIRLWQEKRGEIEPQDLSANLLVQFGSATEDLNRHWFERETGLAVVRPQHFARHPRLEWMGATLDGVIERDGSVYEAKFMLPWNFAEEAAADKHMPQLQHNMLVTGAKRAFLSILTGGAKWISIEVEADPVYQTVLLQVERIFWRCVRTGEPPRVFGVDPPRAKVAAIRVADMVGSNAWAEHAGIYLATRSAYLDHENAKSELKALVPEDAREAFGHGVRAKRSKSGAISFEPTEKAGGVHVSAE